MDLDEAFGKLSEFNIKDHCHVNTNEDGDRFVGIKMPIPMMRWFISLSDINYQTKTKQSGMISGILYRCCLNSQREMTDCLRLTNLLHHNLLIFQSMHTQV